MRKVATAICIGVAITVVIWWLYIFISPNWLWVDYNTLDIGDGIARGASPTATATITYNQPMLIEWDRILYRHSDTDDGWDPVCTTEGKAARYPGYVAAKTTLAGLFDNRDCGRYIDPGEYYVEDNISWVNVIERTVEVDSDPFYIDLSVPAVAVPVSPIRGHPLVAAPPQVPVEPRVHHHVRYPASKVPFPFNLFIH